jgi:hypothetical protein
MPIIPISGSATARGALVPIASTKLTTTASNFFLNSIPQGYQDLMLVLSLRMQNTAMQSNIYVNFGTNNTPDGANNYSFTFLQGNGSATVSGRFSSIGSTNFGLAPAYGSTPNLFGTSVVHIMNYASTTAFKTFLNRNACDLNGSGTTDLRVGLWQNLARLNYIQLGADGLFDIGSSCTLYGVRSVGQ